MFLLKAQWELLGLKAPVFSWVVSAALLGYCIWIYLNLRRESRDRARVFSSAEKKLNFLRGKYPARPGTGISRQLYNSIGEILNGLPLLRPHWQHISSFIIRRTDKNGEERFWIAEEIGSIFNETRVIDNQGYKTAPTVISGVGLLATFLAILVALLDVKLNSNRVQGLDLLVQGLSGKFLSSVVAVACATVLVYAEKGVLHPVRSGITSFTMTLSSLLPRLVPAQILSDLHGEIAEQSNAFKTFNADLASTFKQSFGNSVMPALERMTTAIDDLNHFLRKAEAQKQESISGQLAILLRDLEQSLESSLEKIGTRFNDSLTGSTQGHFKQITESLMNSQFALNQNIFSELTNLTKNTTAHEMASRQAQAEHLTRVVSELMTKLEERTGASMGSMERTLAAITLDISDKVTDLAARMAATVEQASERSTRSATEVLAEAGSLSSRSAQQLAQLLERHIAKLTRVEEISTLFGDTVKELAGSINKHDQVTEGLQKLTSQVNMGVVSLSQIAKSIRETQEAAAQLSLSASGQIESLKGFSQSQQEVWNRIQASMVQYESVFGRVEVHAGELLTQIAQHLGGYSDTTQKHFIQLTSAADNFISQATGRLSASIDELSEQLDELQSAVAGIVHVSRTAA